MADEVKASGMFLETLKRNNKQIRDDRAQAIVEDASVLFKRKLEDLELNVKRMKREQENMLDLSPKDSTSLILASDFNAEGYIRKEFELMVSIHNDEIKLEKGRKRYEYLFGGE